MFVAFWQSFCRAFEGGGQSGTDDKQMADMLNTYFCPVFTKEFLANMRDQEQLYRGEEILIEVDFTPDKVKQKLSDLKPTAAEWADNYHDISYHDKSPLSYRLEQW